MTVFLHELRMGRRTFIIWTLAIGLFMAMCIFLFPQMKDQMESVGETFASMGAFTAAFGMDKISMGTFIGFYAIECGNILSVGGAFFAAVVAVNILSKEEKERTAEYLFTHPVSRERVLIQKLLAVVSQLILMNILVYLISVGSIAIIGESVPWKDLTLLHVAYLLCQIEISLICYMISAFSRNNNFGVGLGMALVLYFMSALSNVSDKARICKVISPFGYAEGSDILTSGKIDMSLAIPGLMIGVVLAVTGFMYYRKKDMVC